MCYGPRTIDYRLQTTDYIYPMPDYFLKIAYDGHDYRGFQWQPGGVVTVQAAIEETLGRVHKAEVGFHGCGRTDAGVHASQYYGHVNLPELPDDYLFILNKQLPAGVSAHQCIPVHAKAHARFDATERTYDFFFHSKPDAFLQRFSSLLPLPNFAPARCAQLIQHLVGEHDFRAFCKTPDRHNTTVCTVKDIRMYADPSGERYRFRFVANRFLRGMIRLLAHDLIRVGLGVHEPAGIRRALSTGKRQDGFRLAPPEGLFLTGVRYPYIDHPPTLPVIHRVAWREIDGR